ncbi:MAG: chemotaxis protein CheW [Kofleriaceae bacterium]
MTQLCTFRVGTMTFGVPAVDVQEILRAQPLTRVPLADAALAGLMNLRGQIVTTIDLRARLGMPPREESDRSVNVVVRCADGVFSLLVDTIGDVLVADPGLFEPIPDHVPARFRDVVAGAYKLSDHLLFALVL